jgi:hypothetical protein
MEYDWEVTRRILESPHVAFDHVNRWMVRQMRSSGGKGPWAAAEQHDSGSETHLIVGPQQALQQPATKESGPTCHEDGLAAHFSPQTGTVIQNVVEVFSVDSLWHFPLLPGIDVNTLTIHTHIPKVR